MKRLIYLVSAIALFCGCQQFGETQDLAIKVPTSSGTHDDNLPEEIYAYMADNKDEERSTRTYIDNNKNILWQKGDAILYCASNILNSKYVFNGENGSASAKFTKAEGGTENNDANTRIPIISEFSLGVYPYDEAINARYGDDNGKPYYYMFAEYPKVQTYAPNSFGRDANLMIAAGKNSTDNNLYFRNACGYLVIKLYGNSTIKQIKLTANNKNIKLSGSASMRVYSNGDFENLGWTNLTYDYVTLNCTNQESAGVELNNLSTNPTEFWFALPPMTIEGGIKISITDGYGNVIEKSTTKDIPIVRNTIQPMAALSMEVLNPEKQAFLYTRDGDSKEPLTFDETNPPFDAEILNHYYDEYKKKFVITFKSQPTLIKEKAFSEKDVTTISIPESIQYIGKSAFEGSRLTSLTLPKNVTKVNANAFSHCRSLATINIEESDKSIEFTVSKYVDPEDPEKLFDAGPFLYSPLSEIIIKREIGDYSITSTDYNYILRCGLFYSTAQADEVRVKLGEKFWSIEEAMFNNLNIKEITIPALVSYIEPYAFCGCKKLETATLNNSVEGDYVLGGEFRGVDMFKGCSALKTVNYGGKFNSIDRSIFSGCSNLKHFNITGEVGIIRNGAFDGFGITSLNISGQVGTIGKEAFDDCDQMTSFTVTGTVDIIGERAFNDCDALATVNISGIVNTVGRYAFSDCDAVTSLAIKANVVEDYAYEDMDGLKTATLYGATVGEGVFYDCNNLEELVVDSSVNSIGNDAFYNCDKLWKVTFNSGANSLTIGYQPSWIDDVGPFYLSPLKEIYLGRTIVAATDYANKLKNWDMGVFTNKKYSDSSLTVSVELDSNVKSILPWMFNCVRIKSITIPASVTSIGERAFYWCKSLTSIKMTGQTPPTLGSEAFLDCDQLAEIKVPNGYVNTYQSTAGWGNYSAKISGWTPSN